MRKLTMRIMAFIALLISQLQVNAETIVVIYPQFQVMVQVAEAFSSLAKEKGFDIAPFVLKNQKDTPPVSDILKAGNYLFTMGDLASSLGLSTGLPGVFAQVMEPVAAGLIDDKGTYLGNMIGISINVHPEAMLSVLKPVLNEKFKGIVFYHPNSTRYLYDTYKETFDKELFPLTGIEVTKDVVDYFSKIQKGNCVFTIVDSSVYNRKSLGLLFRHCIMYKIPVVTFSESVVNLGALIGFYGDNSYLANQVMELMQKRIYQKDQLSSKIYYPEKILYAVNENTSKILNIPIPQDILNKADRIFHDIKE